MRLHQIRAAGLPIEFPPLATTQTTLPAPRRVSSDATANLRPSSHSWPRTHSSPSPARAGAARRALAIESARHIAHYFPDGVRFVDLATVTEDASVDDAVGDGLGLTADLGGSDTRGRLVTYLSSRQMLVILDNCEHLLDVCADLSEAILEGARTTRLLDQAREPLGVDGEHVFIVPSFDVGTEATRLFEERAKAARPSSSSTKSTAGNRADLPSPRRDPTSDRTGRRPHLEPSPTQILERLDDRFRLRPADNAESSVSTPSPLRSIGATR